MNQVSASPDIAGNTKIIDTTEISNRIRQAENMENKSYIEAVISAKNLLNDAKKMNYVPGIMRIYCLLSKIEHGKGNFKNSIPYLKSYIQWKETKDDTSGLAAAYNNLGLTQAKTHDYTGAVNNLTKAFRLFKKSGYRKGMASALINEGMIYEETSRYHEAVICFNQALELKKEMNDSAGIFRTLTNLGATYSDKKGYDTAIYYYREAEKYLVTGNFRQLRSTLSGNFGITYFESGNIPKAKEYLLEAINMKKDARDNDGLAVLQNTLAKIYFSEKKPELAENLLKASISISKEQNDVKTLAENYLLYSEIFASRKMYDKALLFYKYYSQYRDSLQNVNMSDKLSALQSEFEYERQLFEISGLKKDRETQRLKLEQGKLLIAGIIAFSGLIILSGMAYFVRYRYRKKIEGRILLQKKILEQTVRTEEAERKRVAEELHDGIGPLLSGIKLCLEETGNEKLSAEDRQKLSDHTKEMISSAISGIREISNNLMPHILQDYGLIQALRSFCSRIGPSPRFYINIAEDAQDILPGKSSGIILYRVLTELINNTIKHAGAKEINLSLGNDGKNIRVTYSDNGKGFDVEDAMRNNNGFGLRNIRNRIDSIAGGIRFESGNNKGFLAEITIPVSNGYT